MKNFKIGQKLMVLFGIILIFFSLIVWVSIEGLQKNNQNFTEFYQEVYQPFVEELQESEQVNTVFLQEGESIYQKAEKIGNSTVLFIGLLSLLLVGITIGLAVVTIRGLTKPLAQLEQAANELAQGNMDSIIDYHSKDELGTLSEKMRSLMETLKTIISDEGYLLSEMAKGNFNVKSKDRTIYTGEFSKVLASLQEINRGIDEMMLQISQTSDQVAIGAEQVSYGAQALSEGAVEQAASVEELASAVDEISNRIQKNSQSVKQVSEMAEVIEKGALQGNQKMKEMVLAMENINKSSDEIAKIMKTIEDIAFQTKILALNAAVEAARAGSSGKGFAVVADEVRSLAAQSAEASNSITELIQSSLRAVENGTKIATETANSLDSMMGGIQEATKAVFKIANASEEQAKAVSQVTQELDQISSVVQTNSATAQQSAAASQQLASQAQIMKDCIGRFQLASRAN